MLGFARVWGGGRAQGNRWPRAVIALATGSALVVACGRTATREDSPVSGASGASGIGGTGGTNEMSGSGGIGGTSGAGGAPEGGAAGVGVTLSEAPPFSLPMASLPELTVCESIETPEPLGFLADGRALVVQRSYRLGRAPAGDLIRAWDPSTRELETLLIVEPGARLLLSNFGHLFELSSLQASVPGYRKHDLLSGGVSSSEFVPVSLVGASGVGNFVLDERLRRLTPGGVLDLDFAPLLSPQVRAQARYGALSYSGKAIAVPYRDFDTMEWSVELVYDDGRTLELASAPPMENCCNATASFYCGCRVSFSQDGRYVLGVAAGQARVWDAGSGGVVLRADAPQIRGASFVSDTNRVLVAGEEGAFERAPSESEWLPVAINHPWFATGPDGTLGYLDGSLVVAKGDEVQHSWSQPSQNWAFAVAVTENASFAIVDDSDFDAPFPLMVARYEQNVAGPTALFRPKESQSEWVGRVTLSPDEKQVAVAFPDSVRVLDAKTLDLLVTLPTGAGALVWSPDGRYLVTSPDVHYRDADRPAYSPKKTLDFWEAASGKLAARHVTPVFTQDFAFSADGAKIVASGQDFKMTRSDDSPSSLTFFEVTGGLRSFALDVLTGSISESALGRIIGSTREVVATERGLFRVSTEAPLSLFASMDGETELPQVVLAPDASVGTISTGPLSPGQLFVVADAARRTEAPFEGTPPPVAISAGGHRLAAGKTIYCDTPAP